MRTFFAPVLFLLFLAAAGFGMYCYFNQSEHGHTDEHAAAAAAELDTVVLNAQALLNSGIDDQSLFRVAAGTFSKELTIPAMVIGRPGKSLIKIPSPVSGVIAKIFAEPGCTLAAGEPVIELTLTTPELAETQTELIDFIQRLENTNAEYKRLEQISEKFLSPEIRHLSYQKNELESSIANHQNLLRLLGLSEDEIIDTISKKRQIVKTMLVKVPETASPLQLNDLLVELGEQVQQGTTLCNLGSLSELFIEGKVFAFNENLVTKALIEKKPVNAVFDGSDALTDLHLRSVDNRIDPRARTLSCFVEFRNRILSDKTVQTGGTVRRFITWQFKPGQRCELNIQYETIENCIVLPVNAVAKELNETSVFEWVGIDNGQKIWRKRPVHLLYQTKSKAVIANDGAVFPDAQIAGKGTAFLLNALNAQRLKPKGRSGVVDHGDHVH